MTIFIVGFGDEKCDAPTCYTVVWCRANDREDFGQWLSNNQAPVMLPVFGVVITAIYLGVEIMGFSGISFGELLLVLVVLLLLFGSKKLPRIASDLGTALHDLRRSLAGGRGDDNDEGPVKDQTQER
jgi:sec-independent protein translocase protein TatA